MKPNFLSNADTLPWIVSPGGPDDGSATPHSLSSATACVEYLRSKYKCERISEDSMHLFDHPEGQRHPSLATCSIV